MSPESLKKLRSEQHENEQLLLTQIGKRTFTYSVDASEADKMQAKLNFLRTLKQSLQSSFRFTNFQAEFIVNECMTGVLLRSNEFMLVAPQDTKKAEKLVRASFLLANRYFRFIETMLD